MKEKILQLLNTPYNHLTSWANKATHIGITVSLCVFLVYGLNAFNIRAWIHVPDWVSFLGALDFIIISLGILISAMTLSQYILHVLFKNRTFKTKHLAVWLVAEVVIISAMMTAVFGNTHGNSLFLEWYTTLKYFSLLIVLPYVFSLLIISALNSRNATTTKTVALAAHLFHFRDEKDQVKLSIEQANVLYIESTDNYVTIYYRGEETVQKELVRNTLKGMETEFANKGLMRCHRSFIVNVSNIENIRKVNRGYQIKIKNVDTFIPVSKSFIPRVQDLLSTE